MQTSASAYERQQAILELVNRLESIRVSELAEQLDVSESTIRTDLEVLDERGLLVRVRGGAIAIQSSPAPAERRAIHRKAQKHVSEKTAIARWAAGLVEDGDVIMVDASSTVLHIASFLHDRHNLTVFTNGISVAQSLAREPSNTVIILGGILRPNGNAITGEISKPLLRDYHVRTAFVSCSGFKSDLGFFEMDMHEAQMKALMIKSAQRRVAMLDSSKIDQLGLTVFASLDDFDYFVTDEGVPPATIQEVRGRGTQVIVCSQQTTQTYSPYNNGIQQDKFTIGFANLSENTPFSRDVRRSLENAVAESHQLELIVADNQLDPQVAMDVADQLIAQKVDLAIEYQIDETTGNLIAHKFQQAGIPLIAVDIPMVGAVYFGVNNYQAGRMAGVELGRAVQTRWSGQLDHVVILEQRRAGNLPAMRIQGQLEGLREMVPDIAQEQIITLDSDNTVEGSYEVMQTLLGRLSPDQRIAVISFNDDAAVGALYAARDANFTENLLLVGQGADRRLRSELRKPKSPVVGATAYRPEDYGQYLVQLALDILAGKQVTPAVYMEHFFVNADNVDETYPGDSEH